MPEVFPANVYEVLRSPGQPLGAQCAHSLSRASNTTLIQRGNILM